MNGTLPNFVVLLALGNSGLFQVQFYLKHRKLLNSNEHYQFGINCQKWDKFTGSGGQKSDPPTTCFWEFPMTSFIETKA